MLRKNTLNSINLSKKNKRRRYRSLVGHRGSIVSRTKKYPITLEGSIRLTEELLTNIKTIQDKQVREQMTDFFKINFRTFKKHGDKLHKFYNKLSEKEASKELIGKMLNAMIEDYFKSITNINDFVQQGRIKNLNDILFLKEKIEVNNNYFKKAMVFNLIYSKILEIEQNTSTIYELEKTIQKNKQLLEK